MPRWARYSVALAITETEPMDPETLIVALRKNAVLVVMHVVLGTIIGLVFGLLTPAQYTPRPTRT